MNDTDAKAWIEKLNLALGAAVTSIPTDWCTFNKGLVVGVYIAD
jgi:hypothetical protein